MADKQSGDHLLNRGPLNDRGGKGGGSRYQRRQDASKKYAGKTDMGRDELFRQRLQALPKGKRVRLTTEDADQSTPDSEDQS